MRLEEPRRRRRQARTQARRPAGPRRAGARQVHAQRRRAAGPRHRPSGSRAGADRHAAITTPATPRPPTSARRSPARRPWSSPTTTPVTASAPPHRAPPGSRCERREATPSAAGSLGSFYSFVTLLLGMKFGEHEYKVMGMAPYASGRRHRARRRRAGRGLRPRRRHAGDLRLAAPGPALPPAPGGHAGAALRRHRRAAPSRWWRRRCCAGPGSCASATAAERLALGGGVFMNVKANMRLADEEWVRDLFVFPSCGDESNAVGAAYLGYLDLCARRQRRRRRCSRSVPPTSGPRSTTRRPRR